MQVTRLTQLADCWEICTAWDCMAHGIPFRRTAWLLSWWNHFQSSGELYVLRVTDDAGQVVGIAPWYVEQTLRSGRVVRPLGSGSACSDYLGLLTTTEHEAQVSAALSQWLVEAAAGKFGPEQRWDLLDLVSVDARDDIMKRFMEQLESVGVHVHHRAAMSCWSVPLPASWDAYLETLGRSHKRRVRRADKKWLSGGGAQFHVAQTEQQCQQAMRDLITLHQQRQQSLGHAGCFADPLFEGFLREAASRLLSDQMLRLCWLELAGETVAVDFLLTGGDVTYSYLGGINGAMADCSPGTVVQTAILQQCIAEEQREFDYLRGDEAYKFQWGVVERKCFDYRAVPQHHTAQLRHQMWLAGGAMKQWIRSGLHLAGWGDSSLSTTESH